MGKYGMKKAMLNLKFKGSIINVGVENNLP
jgi:hypothetical protein